MSSITLKHGRGSVTLTKSPLQFAVRLKRGRASSKRNLETACGPSTQELAHVDSAIADDLEIFRVMEETALDTAMDELRQATASEVVTHIYSLDDTPGGEVIPTGIMTIQFTAETDERAREAVIQEFGLEVLDELDYLEHAYSVRLTAASTINPLKIAAELQRRSEIRTAEADLSFRLSRTYIPSDTLYPGQWHLRNRGDALGLLEGADVKAEAAWDITRGSRDIIVCVMDDGFDLGHPDFTAPGKIVSPRDFGQNDFDPSPATADDNHGTACAGVAVAEENGIGVVGLAPHCSFMPIRTSGWLSDQSIANLFQHAIDHNADVISCSWAASAWNFPLSTKMHAVIHQAATQGRSNGKGCVIFFAAGNENRPLNGTMNGRISIQGFALHPDVIAVGASNSLDRRSHYSNYGAELALCAPSSGSPGRPILTTDRRGNGGYSSTDYTNDFGGTSSATPLAAALAALILTVNPSLTSHEVKRIMMETAERIDVVHGNYINGHSTLYGHGRIDAHRALVMATGASGTPSLPKSLLLEHRINLPVPDLGIAEDTITFPIDVEIQEIEINVEIKHTYRGDLRVTLVPPTNIAAEIVLENRSGGSADDIVKNYRSSAKPQLFTDLIGKTAQGVWTLRVQDMAKEDTGHIVKWGLTIHY